MLAVGFEDRVGVEAAPVEQELPVVEQEGQLRAEVEEQAGGGPEEPEEEQENRGGGPRPGPRHDPRAGGTKAV